MAEELRDLPALLECWYLAAECHAQRKAWQSAWEAGLQALQVAKRMDEAERLTSALARAGALLLRLTELDRYREYRGGVEDHLQEFLGHDWRAQITEHQAGPSPAIPVLGRPASQSESL